MSFSNNRIYLPITLTLASINDSRPLIYGHTVRQLSTPIIASITLPALRLATQVPVEISSSVFIRQDVLVDPFVADTDALGLLEPAGNLLRAPILTDEELDQSPGRMIDVRFGSS